MHGITGRRTSKERLPKNSQDMYERTGGERSIFIMPGAGHAESVLTDPAKYREVVEGFLRERRL